MLLSDLITENDFQEELNDYEIVIRVCKAKEYQTK